MNIKSKIIFFLSGILLATPVVATSWNELRMPLSGEYIIYTGELGDMLPLQIGKKKLAVKFTGRTAKDIFNSIGPDLPQACGAGNGVRIREKDDGALSCARSEKGEYSCNIGFDLRTGKSIGGIIC